MPLDNTFFEIAAILAICTLFGFAGRLLRQPLIIMFLAAGIICGPSVLGIVSSHEQIEIFAQIGIALLLFIVGLRLDLHLIKTIGPVALATGIGQIVFTSVIGFAICTLLGMSAIPAAYVSVALTFSSTIIIVKLLSDKKEIDSLHGQIAVGFLIVQDIAAIIALIGLTTLGSHMSNGGSVYIYALTVLVKGGGILIAIAVMMKFVLPPLTAKIAHSHELLSLFAVAWAVLLGAGGEFLGFSKEVGAFLAGVSLASTEYRDSIGARLAGLRDFLLLFFFIDLGARLNWSAVGSQLGASALLSLFVLIGNPIVVLIIMGFMGYRRRTGFLAGLTVAQISEFSLIVVALGLGLGHVGAETVGLVTLVGVVTIFVSTYMILYSGNLYALLSRPLMIFERRNPYRESSDPVHHDTTQFDVILLGMGNYGGGIADCLLRRGNKILVVDFDPAVLSRCRKKNIPVIYGDMTDPEMHEQLPLDKTSWVIISVRSRDLNMNLANQLRNRGYKGRLALTAAGQAEAEELSRAGASLVFRPFIDASEQAVDSLTYAMDFLPESIDWPISFREIKIRSDSSAVGRTISDISLRDRFGVNILAVSRGGRSSYNPEPEFRIFPGDRIIMLGPAEELKDAELELNQFSAPEPDQSHDSFEIGEIAVSENSELAGRSLKEIGFRHLFNASIIGIRRGEEKITRVGPGEKILPLDTLVIVGAKDSVEKLKELGYI